MLIYLMNIRGHKPNIEFYDVLSRNMLIVKQYAFLRISIAKIIRASLQNATCQEEKSGSKL